MEPSIDLDAYQGVALRQYKINLFLNLFDRGLKLFDLCIEVERVNQSGQIRLAVALTDATQIFLVGLGILATELTFKQLVQLVLETVSV